MKLSRVLNYVTENIEKRASAHERSLADYNIYLIGKLCLSMISNMIKIEYDIQLNIIICEIHEIDTDVSN